MSRSILIVVCSYSPPSSDFCNPKDYTGGGRGKVKMKLGCERWSPIRLWTFKDCNFSRLSVSLHCFQGLPREARIRNALVYHSSIDFEAIVDGSRGFCWILTPMSEANALQRSRASAHSRRWRLPPSLCVRGEKTGQLKGRMAADEEQEWG